MNGEPPAKRRKTKNKELPSVSVEVAEPVPPTEEEVPGPRQRQCNLTEIPYEFLTPSEKDEVDRTAAERERAAVEHAEKEKNDSKKARALLGVFIGAGIGMWAAYMLKGKLFSRSVEAAVESASKIIDE